MEQSIQTMSIDVINDIPQEEDKEFSIIRIQGLSDGYNSHGLQISEDVLKKYAHTVLGKFIVSKIESDWTGNIDSTDHDPTETIVGIIPQNAEIKFVENESHNGIFWQVDGVISKLYSNGMIDIFRRDGKKDVSVEFTCTYSDEEEQVVNSYNICGITILGSKDGTKINPSCKGANAEIIKFSESKAEEFYHKNNSMSELKKFAEERKQKLNNSHPVDTSKDAVDMGDWNGNKAKEDLLKEKNFETIGKKVCLDFQGGERILANCKYPVMNLKDGKWVYNAEGLSSARAYGEQHDDAIANKAIALQKKLGLYNEGSNNKMADIQEKDKEKDIEKKDAVETPDVKDKAKDEKIKDEKEKAKDVKDKAVDEKDKAKAEDEKMSSDMNVDASVEAKCAEKQAKSNEELVKELSDKDNLIMAKDAELSELRKFKADTEEQAKMTEVSNMLAEVKDKMSDEEYAKCEKEGKGCKFSEISTWKNGVLAILGAKAIEFSNSNNIDSHMRMNFAINDSKSKSDLWD